MRIRRSDDGAAAVEMALVLPILILLICGIIDFGRAYNARITLANSARESVRVWALGGTQAEATTRAGQAAPNLTVTGVTFSPSTSACTFGGATTVTVTASFTYLTPLVASLAPGTTTLSTDGVMRCGG